MTVADLEASCRFYTGFGLRTLGKHADIAILELRGGTHLLLFQQGSEDAEAEGDGPFDQAGVESLDLMIAGRTREELTAFRDSLIALGITPDPILDRTFFGHHVFTARDPDGKVVTVSTSHASPYPI